MKSAGESSSSNETHANRTNTVPFPNRVATQRQSWTRYLEYDLQVPDTLIDELWNTPDQLMDNGQMLKDGDRCTVVKIGQGSSFFVLKRFNLKGPMHTCLHFGLKTRARNCWETGNELINSQVCTPHPVAFLERGFGPLKTKSYVLTEFVDGKDLLELLTTTAIAKPRLKYLAQDFADIWHRLQQRRISHGDMKATNFLVTRDDRLCVIDLDAMQLRNSRFVFHKHQRKDWNRFMKNWRNHPQIQKVFESAVREFDPSQEPRMLRASA